MLSKLSQTGNATTVSVSTVLQQIQSSFSLSCSPSIPVMSAAAVLLEAIRMKLSCKYNPERWQLLLQQLLIFLTQKKNLVTRQFHFNIYMVKRVWAKKLRKCKLSDTTFTACASAIKLAKENCLDYSYHILNQESGVLLPRKKNTNTAEKLCRVYWTVFIAPAFHKVICKLPFSKGKSNEIKYSPMLSIVLYVQLNWHRRKMFVFPTPNISPSCHSQFVRKCA